MTTPELYLIEVSEAIANRPKDLIGPWYLRITNRKIVCWPRSEKKSIRFKSFPEINASRILLARITDDEIRDGFTQGQWNSILRNLAAAQKDGLLP